MMVLFDIIKHLFLFAQAWRGFAPVQTKAHCIFLCLMMKTMWRRERKMASAMGVTSVCLYHHIISVTNSRVVVVVDHRSQLVVTRLLISPMILLTLPVHPEVHCHPLVLLILGNSK